MENTNKGQFTNPDIAKILSKVLQSLNTVKVDGFSNVSNLCGCMQVLNDVIIKLTENEIQADISE